MTRVRKPVHFATFGRSYFRRGGLWMRQSICGASGVTYWRGKPQRQEESPRRMTCKLEHVTCEGCLLEVMRRLTRQLRQREQALGQRVVRTKTLALVRARHARNGLEALVTSA